MIEFSFTGLLDLDNEIGSKQGEQPIIWTDCCNIVLRFEKSKSFTEKSKIIS